jgi:hypothetical protein
VIVGIALALVMARPQSVQGGGGGALACLGGEFDAKPRARLTPLSGRFSDT